MYLIMATYINLMISDSSYMKAFPTQVLTLLNFVPKLTLGLIRRLVVSSRLLAEMVVSGNDLAAHVARESFA